MKSFSEPAKNMARKFHDSLSEKDSRRHAGLLFGILGKGSVEEISDILAMSAKTIRKGYQELQCDHLPLEGRQRKVGGGRKSRWDDPKLNEAFNKVIEPFLAGDPMNDKIKWTNLSVSEIKKLLSECGFVVSRGTVRKLLKKNGYKKRKIQKRKKLKDVEYRNEQFDKINAAKEDFKSSGDPVISVDTKKKESIGENHKEGESYATGQVDGPDHTYSSLNTGTAVPHGIYDIFKNHAQINIGVSCETAEFLIDSLILWWDTYAQTIYPNAKRILILVDAGGANSYRHNIFKKELQRLANTINVPVVIKHYPSYTSKWNPIEHRVFPHVARVIKGVFIRSIEEFEKLVARAKTSTGLKVEVNLIDKKYEKGKRANKKDLEGCNIKFESEIAKWNYTINPLYTGA